ncbi:sensitivity to high expression protein she9 [Savitreella phatthalungensis]
MERLQTRLLTAGARLNDITGYTGIERLKRDIDDAEASCTMLMTEVSRAKEAYERAISARSDAQREVNDLLQRRASWRDNDADRFTSLFRQSHTLESAEEAAKEALASTERTLDDARTRLSNLILVRYHEEQVWSDKIRRASTYGTWALMSLNIVLFLVVQLGLEPWKRRRLVGSFEEKVRSVVEGSRTAPGEIISMSAHDVETAVPDGPQNTAGEETQVHETWQEAPPEVISWRDLPRAGTSAALSSIQQQLVYYSRKALWLLHIHGTIAVRQAQNTVRWLLSDVDSRMRMEDVTTTAVASSLVGLVVGLYFA